jgi:hypothetical protein
VSARYFIGIDPGITGAVAVIGIGETYVACSCGYRYTLSADERSPFGVACPACDAAGRAGALVRHQGGPTIVFATKMPTLGAKGDRCVDARILSGLLDGYEGARCVLEKARPAATGEGEAVRGKAAFTYAHACGMIQAVLDLSGIAYERVSPNTWRKALGPAGGAGDAPRKAGRAETKKAIERVVRERFPAVGKISQDCLDAVFLAMWAAGMVGGTHAPGGGGAEKAAGSVAQ